YRQEIIFISVDAKGAVLCSSQPGHLGTSVADHAIFHEAMNSRQFRVGEYEINPITNTKGISFGYPIGGGAGGPTGAVIAYLALDWLGSDLRRVPFLPGRTLTVADRKGVVLAEAPNRQFGEGQKLPTPLLGMIN